jgi:hypothetical protein
MVFHPPPAAKLPFGKNTPPALHPQNLYLHCADPPDSVAIPDFVYSEDYARKPFSRSRNPYTCGISGKTYSTDEVLKRQHLLARALVKRLGYNAAEGTEWDRVVALYSLNTVC